MNRSKQHLIGTGMMIGPFVAVAACGIIIAVCRYVQQSSTVDVVQAVAIFAGVLVWFGTAATLLNK